MQSQDEQTSHARDHHNWSLPAGTAVVFAFLLVLLVGGTTVFLGDLYPPNVHRGVPESHQMFIKNVRWIKGGIREKIMSRWRMKRRKGNI